MAAIGDVACTFLAPVNIQNLRQRGELWVVPGVSGFGSRILGLSDSAFTFRATAFGFSAEVEIWYQHICQKQFSDVWTVVDDWAVGYQRCFITQVGPLVKSARINNDFRGNCKGVVEISGVFLPAS